MDDTSDNRGKADDGRRWQSEKMETIGQLAFGIAHDLNNQLAPVTGFAEMLLDHLEDPHLRGYAESILKASRSSTDLTRRLLAFARKDPCQPNPIDIHVLVHDTITLLRHSLHKQIEIRQRLEACPSTVMGTPARLQNALLNLALNARDAMPDGGQLTFATTIVDVAERASAVQVQAGRYLQVSVTDTGIGMDAETQKRLFEPFFTTKTGNTGTGLGLAAVYGTVRDHRGAVRVCSEPGRGSTFTLYLPLLEHVASPGHEPDLPVPALGPLRILVVDDEDLVCRVAAALLRERGHEVVTCTNGVEAIEYYRQSWPHIDLVLLDMAMPGLDGRGTFAALRHINPCVKTLLTSGFGLNDEVQALLDEGMHGFVHKPFGRNDLLRQIAATVQT